MLGGDIIGMHPASGQPTPQRLAERWGLLVCGVALGVLIPLVAAPALNNYRVADSFRLVGQIDFPAALRYFHQTTGFGRNEYRPLVQLSFAWDNLVWGDWAFGYHLTNVLLHTVNCILLLLVFRQLTGKLALSFVAVALFAVHPVNHSRIAWIAARDGTLCMLFLLISWLAYLSSRPIHFPDDPGSRGGSHSGRLVVSGLAYLLALMSYEGAVVFPFVLLATELLLAREPECRLERLRVALRAATPYLLLLVAYAALWFFLFQGKVGGYDLDWSLAGAARNFYRLHYRLFHHIQHWLGVLYLVVLVFVWRQRRQQAKLIAFSLLLVWIGYVPFLPIRGIADRFAYFSCAGVALFLSLCVSEALGANGYKMKPSAVLPAVLVLIFVAYYTHSTQRRFRSWTEAGRISETIPAQLKALRASFPPNSTLVFDQIPLRHGDAHVFPNSFRVAVRRKYGDVPGRIFYYPAAIEPALQHELLREPPAFYFRYLPEQERLVEISAPSAQSSRPR